MEEIIELFFKAANMQRWNDHIRPVELVELDKQAHKIIIAYVIAKTEEDDKEVKIDWIQLIEKFLFDFFYRVVLTDIKPQVFHKMMKEKKEDLNKFVLEKVGFKLFKFNRNFGKKFEAHINSDKDSTEDKIIRAAHYLATNWEFKIIYNAGPFIYRIEETKANIENQIEDHYDLLGVQKFLLGKKLHGFIDLCGQLRFQKRWSHTPRIPETSVLGHMLVVAAITYFFTINSVDKSCDKRIYNNFFGGLFHDLPEILTKDIISPIKQSVKGLDELIKKYEKDQMENKILPLIPKKWADELDYFTQDEFKNKIKKDNQTLSISFDEIERYNENKYSPIDGEVIEVADKLAAFTEALISISHGVRSKELEEASKSIKNDWSKKKVHNVNISNIFGDVEYLIKTNF